MDSFSGFNLKQLREECRYRGLISTGKKSELLLRLTEHVENTVGENKSDREESLVQRVSELEETVRQLRWENVHSSSRSSNASRVDITENQNVPRCASTPVVIPCIAEERQSPIPPQTASTQFSSCATSLPIQTGLIYTTAPVSLSLPNSQFYAPTVSTYVWGNDRPANTLYMCQQPQISSHVTSAPYSQTAMNSVQNCIHENPYMNVRDIMAVLPDFHPLAENSLNSEQFVQRVSQLKEAYGWNDKMLLFAIQAKLKGPAKLWNDSCEIFNSWPQFISKFLTDFPCTMNVADLHLEMAETKRKLHESLEEYYYKMLALGRKGDLPESAIIKYIIRGINDNDFMKVSSSANYIHCHELLSSIRRYVSCNPTRVSTTIRSQNKVPNFENRTDNHKFIPQIKKTEKPDKLLCYNCFNPGHISIRCPQPQRRERCTICLRTNHNTTECPEKKNKPPNANPNIYEIESKVPTVDEDDKILKIVEANGRKTAAFIDPGSSRTLIRRTVAYEVGRIVPCDVTLNGFAGGSYNCTEKTNLSLQIDNQTCNICALVVGDEELEHELLLGRDTLCRQGHRLVIEGEQCWFENGEEINVGTTLNRDEVNQLKTLLSAYRTNFASHIRDLGKCSTTKMIIKLTTDNPVTMRPYRVPYAKRKIIERIISELLDNDIIRPSESAYASPIVLIDKKNGESRLCVDYRKVNSLTVKQPFPMPNLEDQFAQLSGHKYFTTLDLKMGYHQIEVEESSKPFTAFVTHNGHYEYNRMPFGLVNAPAVFQNLMNKIIGQLNPGEAIAYLDDIVLPSEDVQSGLERLGKFLKILNSHGLTVRLDKCKFLATEINYLGHVVNEQGIRPGDEKVTAIKHFKEPTSVTEVRRFLGLTGFFRKFVQDYSLIAQPITKLLRKSEQKSFAWDEEQQGSFNQLKHILCSGPVLVLFDFNAQHEIHTDASAIGLAGVLLQSTDGKKWNPVSYYSRHCSDAESRYHSYELEMLAVVETLDRFRVYVLGKHIRLVTDCSAVAQVKAKTDLKPRIARWLLRLMEYDVEIVHRSGSRLAHVDALSRAPDLPPQEPEVAGFVFAVSTGSDDWVYTMQLQDDTLRHIISVLKGEEMNEQEKQIRKDYELKQHRLYRKTGSGLRFVVPKAVRWRIVQHCHDNFGHFGLEKTIERIQRCYWFPKIRKYVKDYISSCVDCCYYKSRTGKPEGRLYYEDIQPIPFRQLHIDHLGPFKRSKKGNTFIVAISDAFSKYAVVKAVRNTSTQPVINILTELTSYVGLPRCIISDRGTAYTSRKFAAYCDRNNIQHLKVAVRTPRANGQVERANQTILSYLRTTVQNENDWDEYLPALQWAINSQKNSTTGFSPNELIFDFKLTDLTNSQLLAVLHDAVAPADTDEMNIHTKRAQALENLTKEREHWKQRFDKKHSLPKLYSVNDLVLIENEAASTGESRKLEPKFKGPYKVSKILGKDRYLIEDIEGMPTSGRRFCSVYAAERIRPWCHSSPEIDEDLEDIRYVIGGDSEAGLAELSD